MENPPIKHTSEPPSSLAAHETAGEPAGSRTLAVRVHRSILRLAPGRILDLLVDVRGEAIVLSGRCSTYYCKQLAQHAAMELAQGQRVVNQIEVQ